MAFEASDSPAGATAVNREDTHGKWQLSSSSSQIDPLLDIGQWHSGDEVLTFNTDAEQW